MKVKFEYTVGKTRNSASLEVDEDEWSDLSRKEQIEYLKDEIYDRITIVSETINIEEN